MSKIRYRNRNADSRRATAERIASEAANRSPEDQLARLNAAGWRAEKERAKLAKLVAQRRAA